MGKISIERLKNISKLEFNIPQSGVHILTGTNGSGKTSLLTCLERLAYPHAFARHFKVGKLTRVDNFNDTKIIFSNNNNEVEYRYRKLRWAPTPRKNVSVLKSMGFSNVLYLTSSTDRFYVQNEEIRGKVRTATTFFIEAMNEIFQTQKYSNLRTIKLSGRGRGDGRYNYGFVMALYNSENFRGYYSEKNFSLGEVLILNALHQLQTIKNGSLLLIDEVELALHPKVQVNFLKFLEGLAGTKGLTIIISTHSSSLIKAAKNIIYLERTDTGVVNINYNCYPAVVLKDLAFSEDFYPDIIFCVEDEQAEMLLSSMVRLYFGIAGQNKLKPEFKILPIGGWTNVLRFREKSTGFLFPNGIKIFSFLDQDTKQSIDTIQKKASKSNSELELLQLYNRSARTISYLPVTPEQGVYELLSKKDYAFDKQIQEAFESPNLHFSNIISEEVRQFDNCRPANVRDAAKKWFEYVCSEICSLSNWDKGRVQRKMYDLYVTKCYPPNEFGKVRAILGPVFSE